MHSEHRWTVRVLGNRQSTSTVCARRKQFDIGVPLSFDDDYDQATSLEHFLAAIGSDIVSGLQIRAKRRRIAIDNVEATVSCTLHNALSFLEVVGEQGHPGVSEISVVTYIGTSAEAQDVERLWHDTLRISPMIQTLKDAVKLNTTYKIVL